MASWLQQRLKEAEGLLQAVDQTAKGVKSTAGAALEGSTDARDAHHAPPIPRSVRKEVPERENLGVRRPLRVSPATSASGRVSPSTRGRAGGPPGPQAGPSSRAVEAREETGTSPDASGSPVEQVSHPTSVEMTWEQLSQQSDGDSSVRPGVQLDPPNLSEGGEGVGESPDAASAGVPGVTEEPDSSEDSRSAERVLRSMGEEADPWGGPAPALGHLVGAESDTAAPTPHPRLDRPPFAADAATEEDERAPPLLPGSTGQGQEGLDDAEPRPDIRQVASDAREAHDSVRDVAEPDGFADAHHTPRLGGSVGAGMAAVGKVGGAESSGDLQQPTEAVPLAPGEEAAAASTAQAAAGGDEGDPVPGPRAGMPSTLGAETSAFEEGDSRDAQDELGTAPLEEQPDPGVSGGAEDEPGQAGSGTGDTSEAPATDGVIPSEEAGQDVAVAMAAAATTLAPASAPTGMPPAATPVDAPAPTAATALPAAPTALPAASSSGTPNPAPQQAQAREARLVRMVEQLKARLEAARSENEQLEELLARADASASGRGGEVARLEDELAALAAAKVSAEAGLQRRLVAAEADAERLRGELALAATRQEAAEATLGALRAEAARTAAEREAGEASLLASLRAEVESVEGALDEERAAHAASRRAAAQREAAQDARMEEAAAGLSALQRRAEQRGQRVGELEERCAALEAELEGAEARGAALEARLAARGDPGEGEDGERAAEALGSRVAELEAELASATAAAEAAEAARAEATADAAHVRAELAGARQALAESRHADVVDYQRRAREATELLFAKQAQLERASADRAALQLALERETANARAAAAEARRRHGGGGGLGGDRGPGGPLSPGLAAEDVVPLDSLRSYRRLAENQRVGRAVKTGAEYLDAGAREAVRILRTYPAGRLVVLAYLLFVHVMMYLLLHRLQRRAFEGGGRTGLSVAALRAHRDEIGT
uniref:Golgin candidate 1 n=1 Tax=Auxenochlorella protothecoides TaxID=3075 RepID=A0A1D2ABS3_AUXPR